MIEKLIDTVIHNKEHLPYVNLDEKSVYLGWTSDFKITLPNSKKMRLDLRQEKDLFLLFVLASSWSRSGTWENAAHFVTYLKESKKDDVELWKEEFFVASEMESRKNSASRIINVCSGLVPRKKVSFRSDYYSSITVISHNWSDIKKNLLESSETGDYVVFINYISRKTGLVLETSI